MNDLRNEKQQAFEEQALAHSDHLYRYGMGLTGNASDADDLLQETYLKAYRFWESFDQGTNIRAWLFRILKNSFINQYRKESKEPTMVEYTEMANPASARDIAADANNLHELVFNNLLDDDLAGAVSGLPEDFRTVVILCDLEGLTYKEISEFVDCPIGTVRSRLHRGRELLHSRLYGYAKERGYVRFVQNSRESLQCVLEERVSEDNA
jgi:RNA polymerase sigma-70 factor (ECF subfamily)